MTLMFLFPAVSYIHAMKALGRIYGPRWSTKSWVEEKFEKEILRNRFCRDVLPQSSILNSRLSISHEHTSRFSFPPKHSKLTQAGNFLTNNQNALVFESQSVHKLSWTFWWFSSVPQGKFRDCSRKLRHEIFNPHVSKSFIYYHSLFRRSIAWDTDSIIN